MPSSVVAYFNYDEKKQVLRVGFVSGLIYEYHQVPGHIYTDMTKSSSKGTFLNRYIKGNYKYRKVE